MGEGDGVANGREPTEQIAEFQSVERLPPIVKPPNDCAKIVSLDEPHRVKRATVLIRPKTVHRNDAGMLELAGDLRFANESPDAGVVHDAVGAYLFQSDFTSNFRVLRQKDFAEPPAGVWTNRMKAAPGAATARLDVFAGRRVDG
jgi:hypothetical protein